ncbi:MAG: hypothetical protein RA162_00250 [Arsenophonus sp.]|nr:MAG: hypothetical protein RA162_00250 [Arsenophonus sp.]
MLFDDKHKVSFGINKNLYITIPRKRIKNIKIDYKLNNILEVPFKKIKLSDISQ